MASKPMPAYLASRVRAFSLAMQTSQIAQGGELADSMDVLDRLRDRWLCTIEFAPLVLTNGQQWRGAEAEAWLASLRGQVNTVPIYHRRFPRPRGTLAGSPVLAATAAQGAASLSVATTAGATLLPGDCLGVGGLLLQVEAVCTANGSGVLTVPLVNRVRRALASGTAVVWDAPTVPMRVVGGPRVHYEPGLAQVDALDLVEDVTA